MLMAMAFIMFYTSYLVLKSVKLDPGEHCCLLWHHHKNMIGILKI